MAKIKSVARAAQILKAFGPLHSVLTVRELATITGISRSSYHALASTLVAEGLLESIPGGGYQLGQELATLGGMVLERTGIVERATPLMEELSVRLGGEIHLGYSHGEQLIYLARIRRDRRTHMPNRYGEPVALHRTGAGWAVLMTLPRTQQLSILSTIARSQRETILNALRSARHNGFVLYTDTAVNAWAVAAPVRISATVTAALSIAHSVQTMNERRLKENGAHVVRACRALEQTLTSVQ